MGPLDSPEEVTNRASTSIAGPPAPPAAAGARSAAGATGDDGGTDPGPGPPFALVPSDRRTLLSLAAWPLGAIARLENLVVEIPTPTSPGASAPDLLPIERLRNRRGRLVAATLTTDLARIARELERPGMRARLAAAGIRTSGSGWPTAPFTWSAAPPWAIARRPSPRARTWRAARPGRCQPARRRRPRHCQRKARASGCRSKTCASMASCRCRRRWSRADPVEPGAGAAGDPLVDRLRPAGGRAAGDLCRQRLAPPGRRRRAAADHRADVGTHRAGLDRRDR